MTRTRISIGMRISENTLAAVLISVFPFRSSFDSAVVCRDIKGGPAVCLAAHLRPPLLQSILSLHGCTAGGSVTGIYGRVGMINNGLPLAHSLRNKCHLPSLHLPQRQAESQWVPPVIVMLIMLVEETDYYRRQSEPNVWLMDIKR